MSCTTVHHELSYIVLDQQALKGGVNLVHDSDDLRGAVRGALTVLGQTEDVREEDRHLPVGWSFFFSRLYCLGCSVLAVDLSKG